MSSAQVSTNKYFMDLGDLPTEKLKLHRLSPLVPKDIVAEARKSLEEAEVLFQFSAMDVFEDTEGASKARVAFEAQSTETPAIVWRQACRWRRSPGLERAKGPGRMKAMLCLTADCELPDGTRGDAGRAYAWDESTSGTFSNEGGGIYLVFTYDQ